MENKQMKCVKGKTCLYCGSNYCQYMDEVNQLKAENEELKKNCFTAMVSNCEKCKHLDLYIKYEQTLTEIKEIAENGKRFAERYMITGEQKANVLTYANAILQKISEVVE